MVPGLANEKFTTPPSSPIISRRSSVDNSVQISYEGGSELQLGIHIKFYMINDVSMSVHTIIYSVVLNLLIIQETNQNYISCNTVRNMVR